MDHPEKMTQAEIDALLKDSMFGDSELTQSRQPAPRREIEESNTYAQDQFQSYQESYVRKSNAGKNNVEREKNIEQSSSYANEEFQSYEESRKIPQKNVQKQEPKGKVPQPPKKKLEDIQQEVTPKRTPKDKKSLSKQKPKSNTAIYFYPPKKTQTNNFVYNDKKNLHSNFSKMQDREKELLFTTLTEENQKLKEELRIKDNQYQKLDKAYKVILQDKAHQASSVKQVTLQKQLASLQSRYEKLENLIKLEKNKNSLKTTKLSQSFVPSDKVSQRQEELLEIIDTLKERLISTDTELKTLQKKMSEGENYIDQLKRKMKRVEQLQYKMQKMADQADNDREYIVHLKENNAQLEKQLFDVHKQKRLMEIEVRRYELGQATQNDTINELKEVRMQKQKLQRNLRQVVMNMSNLSKIKSNTHWNQIEDSGQLLKP